jgi:prepilin-type N-terminal cleavage/methylation domain-containing protein
MRKVVRHLRACPVGDDESGTTLVELMISMMILGIVLAAIYSVLASVQGGFSAETDRSVNASQAGLVMQQLAKEIQSAEAFSLCSTANCSTVVASGASCTTPTTPCYLVVYTQTNASTRQIASPGPNAPFSCVEWRVAQVASSPVKYAFQSRRWQLDWENNPSSLVTGWRYVSDPLPSITASYLIPTTSAFGGRLMQVTVTLNNQPTNWNRTTPTSVTRQLTGANVLSASAPNPCIPPNGTLPA